MIISVRGTSGAGKSHLVRTIFEKYAINGGVELLYPEIKPGGRRRPSGMILVRSTRRLFVPGHYVIANGGIDTVPNLELAYDMICKHHEIGCDVLYEGKAMSDGVPHILKLHECGWDVRVVLLSTPLAECVASVRLRGHNIKEESIRKTYQKCLRNFATFEKTKLTCARWNREEAAEGIFRWLTT